MDGTHWRLDAHPGGGTQPVTKHVVTLTQTQRWLDGATQSPNERVKKDRLKRLLSER